MEKTKTIIRHSLTYVGAILVSFGLGSEGYMTEAVGGIMTLISMVLSFNADGKTLQEKLTGIFRHLLALFVAFTVEFKGAIPEETVTTITEVATNYWILFSNVIVFVWSLIEKKLKK